MDRGTVKRRFMPPHRSKLSKKTGLPPGSLVYIGETRDAKPTITVIDYDEGAFDERTVKSVEECLKYTSKPTVTWINVDGLNDVDIISELGSHLNIHPLVQEDILNTHQRPKFEDHDDYIAIILRMLRNDPDDMKVISEQISLILTPTCVVSFQEVSGDVFEAVRERLRAGKGRIRRMGADYLAYALADAVVDNYFTILESYGDRMSGMEEKLIEDPRPEDLHIIHLMKRELIGLRKAVWPLREVVNRWEKSESDLVKESTGVYLRDVYDHTMQVMDTVESHRDTASSLTDLYLSSVSNRMNEVMKVLTIIATIFIPLTFIAGIFGMNFNPDSSPFNMPELNWYWGYVACVISMIVVAAVMVVFFKRRGWL